MRVSLTTVVNAKGVKVLRCSVADSGIGIPEASKNALFEVFSQADISMARRYGGSGLGLVISQQLADLMGGNVAFESETGKGSCFWLDLPLIPVTDSKYKSSWLTHEPLTPSLNNTHALVVSNSPFNVLAIQEKLKRLNIVSLAAKDADQASLLEFPSQGIDWLILDEEISPIDLQNIKQLLLLVCARTPKTVLLTQLRSSHNCQLANQKEADICLSQPVLIQDLVYSLLHQPKINQQAVPTSANHSETNLKQITASSFNEVKQHNQGNVTSVENSNQAIPRSSQNTEITSTTSSTKLQVLIVDDNAINREIVCSMLRKMECEPIVAKDGLEAVEISKNEAHDIILMDVQMPGMDGLEASRTIRQRELELDLPRKPIIALTANAMTDDKENCIKAGMDDYLTKPFTRVQLTELMNRWTQVIKQ